MTAAHKRQKNPSGVRQGLLDQASAIAADRGLAEVTVAAVAAAAGVTKGALFHHFSDKQALIEAMFDNLMTQLDKQIDTLMANDPLRYGRFTRAYVLAATSIDENAHRVWSALFSALSPGSELCRRWYEWLDKRVELHRATDAGPALDIVRLAADGAWLMSVTRKPTFDVTPLRSQLLAMTTGAAKLET